MKVKPKWKFYAHENGCNWIYTSHEGMFTVDCDNNGWISANAYPPDADLHHMIQVWQEYFEPRSMPHTDCVRACLRHFPQGYVFNRVMGETYWDYWQPMANERDCDD